MQVQVTSALASLFRLGGWEASGARPARDRGYTIGGVFIPVSESSDDFQNNILAPLQSAYLYDESKQSFRYKSAVLIKNSALEEKYNAFRAKRREIGYSEEDLEENYGFLLFDDINKAKALGETGVLTGNSTCTTLGDPLKGVYISMYSDCLDLNRWYHGKSGYIAIIRLTKGRVKKVLENYTQNLTAPTRGFDCHMSEQLPSVSAKTSSFLAFERTQYYMYELLHDGSNEAAQSPSLACPFAIVSFSYTDTKASLLAPQEKSEEKKQVSHYVPWRGQLQIGTQFYDVGLRSTAGAMIPAKLPPVVKVDRAISMSDLRRFLPRAVFETCFSGEVFLDSLYCILFELVSSVVEETSSLSVLLQEIKEKDLALTIPLNDGGFLILLHSSHFLTYDDTGSSAAEVLQGLFVFPDSRVIQRDTKLGQKKAFMSSEILRVLPVLSYAEGEVEKIPIDSSEDLCDVLAQHMQSYAALINPGLALSPSREASIFPDQYDVPDAHKHLYSSPEWTNRAWQSFRSYLNKPASFQLPVSKASEILTAGQEERREDLDDDVYICLSSPEEVPASPVSMGSEDQLAGQKSPANIEPSVDSCLTSAEAQVNLTDVSQDVVPNDLQAGDATKDTEKSDLTELIKTDDMGAKTILTPPTSDDLPAELIVSITSAERTVTDESLSVISTVSATKHNDFQLPAFSTAKLQTAGVNTLNDETVKTKSVLDCPQVTIPTKTRRRKLRRGHSKARKKASKARVETPSLQAVKIPEEIDDLKSQKDDKATEPLGQSQLNEPPKIDWRKLPRHKRKFIKLSPKHRMLRSATVGLAVAVEKETDSGKQTLDSTILMELDTCSLRKKTERWDLKPVISECGRILVPHGSVDFADQIKSLKDKLQSTKDAQIPEEILVDVPANAHNTVEMEQESSIALETAVDETEVTKSKDGGNHLQNIVSHVNPEHSILRQLNDGNGSLTLNSESSELSSKKDSIETPPSKAAQEKHTDRISPTKGEFLLSKLKSVLLRGKRKTDLISDEKTAGLPKEPEPCLKKSKGDSDREMLKSTDAITGVQTTNVGVKEVSKMLSVDPLFAYALGLTPKERPDKVKKTEEQDTQLRKDTSETKEQTISEKQPQIIQRPPSIFPRRGRIKTLKKHQDIPAEYIKKKWWLHFQTPACYTSEKLKNKECTRDNSVRKTVKEKMHTACSSTDALNLLADLALGASNDQVPPQPEPELERKPESSLKKCGLTKDVTCAEQESVLHALLRQSAARPIQPLESPSPSHLVGGSELVGLISKEHAYSLPPSSSLLLGLPGTPFQVSPISGSTRLLHHHQTMYGNGIQTLHPSVGQEDRDEHNLTTPKSLKKHMVFRKFRNSRTFVQKDGSLEVTRQWKENYDFNLDSKFSTDSKHRAIIRALHGPWDFSMQDTNEELRLIVHMWIGLFYSRSTARLFHIESNFTHPCSEESDSLEISMGTVSAPAQSELKANSFAPLPVLTNTSDLSVESALDLSKKDISVVEQGSEILDLSLRNCNAEIVTSDPRVNRKETSVSREQKEASETLNLLKSPVGLHECHRKMVLSTEIINVVNDVRSTLLENIGCLEHTCVPSGKGDEIVIPVQEEIENVSVQPEDHGTGSGIGHMLHGSNNKKTEMKDCIEKSEDTEMSSVQKHEMDSSKSMTDKQVDHNKEAGDVVYTVEHDETESKDGEKLEVKENPYQESNIQPSPKVVHTGDDSTNKELGTVCNGNLLEDESLSATGEPKAVSPDQAENVNEDEDCCIGHEDKVIEDENRFEKENGLDEKNGCISAKEDGSDLSDQPVPMMCDSPDSIKENCITECNRQEPLDEQPPQADSTKDVCHDLELRKLCANGSALTDENAISDKAPNSPSGMDSIHNQPAVEANSETYICSVDKAHIKKAALLMSDESTFSLEGSYADESIPQTKDTVETGSQNEVMKNLSFGPSSEDHEDQDTKSIEREEKADSTTQKEPFRQQSPLPQCAVTQKCEAEVTLTDETDWNRDRSNEGLANIHSGVIIPFIGIDTSGEDTVEPHVSHPQVKVEEVVKGQREIPFITDTTFPKGILPIEVYSTSKVYSKEAELSAHKIPLLDVSETNQPMVLGSESDDRCPTPTMDEKPYKYIPCSGTSSTSAFSGSETRKNLTQKYLSRSSTPVKDEMPVEQKRCHTFTVNSDHNPPHGLHPDLELRTLRVLQSIDKFLSKRRHTDKSNQNETDVMKHSHDQTPNPSSKHIPTCFAPSHTAAKVTDNKIKNTKPAVVAASTSQELSAESSDHSLISPFKSKLEEVLGVRLQLKKTDSTVHQQYFEKVGKLQETSIGQDCHPYRSLPSTESLQAIKPNTDQDRHKITSQTQLTHEPRSYSQRPVMAVKPSKSDESQTDCIIEEQIENSSKNKLAKIPVVTFTTSTPMLLERKTESCKGYPERLNYDKQEASELFSKSSWISNVNDSKSNSDKAKLALQDLSYQYQGTGISKLINISSLSTSMQSFESAKSSSKLVGGNQHLLTYSSLEKVRQTTKENINMDQKACSNALASLMDYKDDSITDDSLVLGPQSSLACTIYNTSQERSYSFLEQLSQRCLQDDLTQASMEQECLIFSEQMKQLLKRSKGGPICQEDTHDKLKFPCVTPVTVHFSGLEEQGETVDHLDAPSLVGLKIMVDMSDRKSLADTTEEEKTLHLERMSQATSNPLEHAGVSGVTAECTTLYKAMMNNVCSGTKVLSRPKSYRMGRIHPKTEPSNHFDFCGQMKRKMDESFRSNLNSVVKKSCRTKYRFYILVTSDDAFFEETKAQLEAEGHTAVQPSEFFLGEDSSSSLLIILRNEDIAEHICEVPHLLELKKSPGVQFAGIDEPDDVVNLTHQELFTRGGFIVLDKAALEPLSLCNMKKMSEILQELSKTGKWKWMLHYRDSRRLKENARLSAEAKEKKHFLNWCQEAGLLEVLPYHECDLMSKDRPDYLSCLVRLQVQNVSARYLVFVTDTTTDDAFGRNGILTMTVNSFLTNSPSETFTV
ncbi:uncharacterized protein tasor2 isoform X5 [Thunnus albacares]|uniref:uncharacterized protein tasor2 isoform X5 n=1 Tax=Thunnus albacares TaxID=8236 RepID=UPI001CF6482C|nr:uncharacterized protein tasor2 isoform X5 [Thunnus albacares]